MTRYVKNHKNAQPPPGLNMITMVQSLHEILSLANSLAVMFSCNV